MRAGRFFHGIEGRSLKRLTRRNHFTGGEKRFKHCIGGDRRSRISILIATIVSGGECVSGFYSLVRPLIRLTRGIGSLTAVFAKLIDDHAGEWGSRFTDRCPKSKRCATLGANERGSL